MHTTPTPSAALPMATVALRILIILNWVGGAMILALLVVLPNEQWIMQAFKLAPSPDASRVVWGLRAVALLGLGAILLNYGVLTRLRAMVDTLRARDPFVPANAQRLRTIAWLLLSLQVLSMIIGGVGDAINSPAHPINLDAGFSPAGWLAVLVTFLLAEVFAEGARLRDDLAGTV